MNYNKKLSAITRLQSIDVLRGAVMVLMAIDHVRVYSGLPRPQGISNGALHCFTS